MLAVKLPAFKASFSGFKAPVFGLLGLLTLKSGFAQTTQSENIPKNLSELSFSFSNHASLNHAVSNRTVLLANRELSENLDESWKKTEQLDDILKDVFSSGLPINDPVSVRKDFQQLIAAEIFNLKDVTPLEYARQIAKQMRNPYHEVFQGKRATCGATNVQSALVRFNPDLFVKIAVGIAVSKDAVFKLQQDGKEDIEFLIPADCFKPDDSRRDAVSRLVQSCLMEYLNGDSLNYSNQNNFHYNKDGAGGKGVKSESTAALMSKLFSQKFVAKDLPLSPDLMQAVSEMSSQQPVFVTLNWRRLSEAELEERYANIGGNRDQYLSQQGYLGHMLSLVSIDSEQVTLTTTWSSYMHDKYADKNTLGRETTPEGQYDSESGLIKMEREVFDSRVKMLIYPEPSDYAKAF